MDEIDSGLDVDAFKQVAKLIQEFDSKDNSFIIITHYFSILDYIPVDRVYILENGKVVDQGSVALAHQVKKQGFEK